MEITSETILSFIVLEIGFIIWLARLEYSNKQNTKDIDDLSRRFEQMESKHLALDVRMVAELTEIKILLAKIIAKLNIELK